MRADHESPHRGGGKRRDKGRDKGAASVWAAVAVAALLVVAMFGVYLGMGILGRHRAEAAADLAALAAAGYAADGEIAACAHAARVTTGMTSELVSCRLVGWEVFVEVEIRLPLPPLPAGVARGRARAGPAELGG